MHTPLVPPEPIASQPKFQIAIMHMRPSTDRRGYSFVEIRSPLPLARLCRFTSAGKPFYERSQDDYLRESPTMSDLLNVKKIPVAEVVFREDLYPRTEGTIGTNVQAFAEDLSVLPPIEVNQDKILIDGWHRWTAHKKAGATEIPAIVTQTNSDVHLKELACERNAAGVRQMTQGEKRDNAREFYNGTPQAEREAKKAQLTAILKVSERTIREWLSRIDKDSKAALRKQAFDMWLAMATQGEIAATIGYDRSEIARFIQRTIVSNGEPAVSHETHDSDEGGDESNSRGRIKLTKEQIARAAMRPSSRRRSARVGPVVGVAPPSDERGASTFGY